MVLTMLEKKGIRAYRALGECVDSALMEENSEYALICGRTLLKLAEVERANYFGTTIAGHYNYNKAHDLAKDVIALAEEKGLPSYFKADLKEMKKILKEGGW